MNTSFIDTPWGVAQYVTQLGEGITLISTANHGGIRVSREKNRTIMAKFPGFKPWAGELWYEEDCDWVFVAVTFPEYFSDVDLKIARDTLEYAYDGKYAACCLCA